jgi:hypothetical protein
MLVRGLVECASAHWEVHENEVIEMDERLADTLMKEGIVEAIAAESAALIAAEHRTQPPRKQKAPVAK